MLCLLRVQRDLKFCEEKLASVGWIVPIVMITLPLFSSIEQFRDKCLDEMSELCSEISNLTDNLKRTENVSNIFMHFKIHITIIIKDLTTLRAEHDTVVKYLSDTKEELNNKEENIIFLNKSIEDLTDDRNMWQVIYSF